MRHRSAREDPIHSGLERAAAMMQSFWATFKKELVYTKPKFKTRDEARAALFTYIETYYNRERIHSSLDYRTPLSFEQFLSSQKQEPILEQLAA